MRPLKSKKEQKLLEKVSKTVKDGDLYDALHNVGDDPIKSDIEDTLRELLPRAEFKAVVAVFKIATTFDDDEIW